jgi:diguanylate cyclase (GGDEF)-like protein
MSLEIPEQQVTPEQKINTLEEDIKTLREKIEALEQENKELMEVALKDPLTGTFNRRGLNETTKMIFAQRNENDLEGERKPIAVLMLDIDDFKAVNDIYGHAEGDRILRETADFLRTCVRGSDIIARTGGEEFAIVFYKAEDQDIFNKFFDKNEGRARIGFDTELGGIKNHRVTMSGGVTMFQPDEDIKDLDNVISRADTALYASKSAGKDNIAIFTKDLDKKSADAS